MSENPMAAIGSALRVARSSMGKGERQVESGQSSPGVRNLPISLVRHQMGGISPLRIAQRGRPARDDRVNRRTDATGAVSAGLRR
jgi:hypothetical protein